MGIWFIINFLLIVINLCIIKKTKEKLSIIWEIFLNSFLFILLNSLVVFILNFLNIRSTLLVRNIIFTLFNCGLLFYNYSNRNKLQKHSINKYEIVVVFFLFLFVGILGFYRYGNNFNFVYETTDPATHYNMALRFEKNDFLLENSNSPADEFYGGDSSSTMFISYVTDGTVFQVIDSFNGGSKAKANAFIIINLYIMLLSGVAVYYLISQFHKKENFITVFFVLVLESLYLFGYPFNDLIFGFHYLGLGIGTIILSFVVLNQLLKFETKIYIPIFILLSFSIFPTYYMFAPISYGGYGLYILYYGLKIKKWSFKKTLIKISYLLIIPFCFGVYYYLIRNHFVDTNGSVGISAFKMEGYIYRGLISNFVLPFIAIIYIVSEKIKKRKFDVVSFSFVICFIFMIGLFILLYNGIIASYYYYKLYYVLWPLTFILIGASLYDESSNMHLATKSILIVMLVLAVCQFFQTDEELYKKNQLINGYTFVSSLDNIYWFNNVKCEDVFSQSFFENNQFKDLDSITQRFNSDVNGHIYYYGNLYQKLWFYNFTSINPNGNATILSSFYLDPIEINDLINNKNINYIVCNNYECNNYENDFFEYDYEGYGLSILKRK